MTTRKMNWPGKEVFDDGIVVGTKKNSRKAALLINKRDMLLNEI